MLTVKMFDDLMKAFKAITVSDLGDAKLQPEKFTQFIRTAQNASPILADARRLDMNSYEKHIDRVGFGARIMKVGTSAPAEVKPTFATNKLIAVKSRGMVAIEDDTVEDNIEREGFENTLLALIGERVGLDFEELFVKGDTGSGDTYLAMSDGWNKLAGTQLTGTANTNFTATSVESMLEAMLVALPEKFRRNRGGMRYYVAFNIENAYRNVLKARGTGLGDTAQVGAAGLAYKGVQLVEVPNMPSNSGLLSPQADLVWGAHRVVRIEPERVAADEVTKFWISARQDCHYEDENAAVYAKNANV